MFSFKIYLVSIYQIVTSTPKIGKNNNSHTVVDIGRNKTNDPIQKRRPSKRLVGYYNINNENRKI